MKKKLLLFDFDGVLVESLDVYVRAIKWSLEKINMPIVKDEADYLSLFDDNFYVSLQQRGIDLDAFFKALLSYTEMMGGDYYADVKPFSFMPPILESLHKKHVMGIISSNSIAAIEKIFARNQYESHFQAIWGSDYAFSKTAKITHALETFQMAPEDTYYIGDTAGDIVEGKLAGVLTVAVTWGWHSRERLRSANPDYLIDSPDMLLTL
jgi:phosphoglycolate phosphatase